MFDPVTTAHPFPSRPGTMRQRHGLLLAAVLAPHQAIAQSSSSVTIFLLDAEPQTVEASVIAYTSGQNPITTLLLSCPSTFAPCISASIDGATAYHTEGSVFGGTLLGATPTTFYCELGSGSGDTIPGQNGECNRTVGSETTSTVLNSAYVSAHQAEMIITAGLEKLSVSTAPCSSRRQLFSTSLPYPISGTTGDVWGWAAECPSTTSGPSTMSSQPVSQTSQSSQTLSQTSSPVTSNSTSPSASSSSAGSTETKASSAGSRIAGTFMFAQMLGAIVVWASL